jgi:hypothetical protein
MSDPMTAGLDPVALLKAARMPKQGDGKVGQAYPGFDAMLETLKTPRAPNLGDANGAMFDQAEPDDGASADIGIMARTGALVSPKAPKLPKTKADKLSQTAIDFEAMLMTQMFQTLRKTVEPSGLFGDNQTERSIYEYLFDQSIFEKAAANGQTWGLASRLEESWKEHFAGNGK